MNKLTSSFFLFGKSRISQLAVMLVLVLCTIDFYHRVLPASPKVQGPIAVNFDKLYTAAPVAEPEEITRRWPPISAAAAVDGAQPRRASAADAEIDGGLLSLMATYVDVERNNTWLARVKYTAPDGVATLHTLRKNDQVAGLTVISISLNQIVLNKEKQQLSLSLFKPLLPEESSQ